MTDQEAFERAKAKEAALVAAYEALSPAHQVAFVNKVDVGHHLVVAYEDLEDEKKRALKDSDTVRKFGALFLVSLLVAWWLDLNKLDVAPFVAALGLGAYIQALHLAMQLDGFAARKTQLRLAAGSMSTAPFRAWRDLDESGASDLEKLTAQNRIHEEVFRSLRSNAPTVGYWSDQDS